MAKEIAVFLGGNGETAPLHEAGKIVVYRKKQGAWSVAREKPFLLEKGMGMKELRKKMGDVLDFLAGCRVFAGLSVTGVPYFELEKAGFSVWEYEGKPASFLDEILREEEEKAREDGRKRVVAIPVPVETSGGCYRISIKEIQENDTGLTSKQVLLPFLRKGLFYSLEVTCNHVPPWLEAELAGGGLRLNGVVEKISSHETKITITRKCCQDTG